MQPTELQKGDVVQLNPGTDNAFVGCFMLVLEPKNFGAVGYVPTPEGKAFYRASWDEMEYVGRAQWVAE